MTTRVIDTLEDLEALKPHWATLPQAEANPLLSHDWYAAAARTLHQGQRISIVTVWRGSELAGVAPLVEDRRQGTLWLDFIGSRVVYEPTDVLYRDMDAIAELSQSIAALGSPASLLRLPADSPLPSLLDRSRAGVVARVKSPPCLHVAVAKCWDEYLATRSQECRAGFPRKRRQLAAGGVVAFESLTPDATTMLPLLDEFVRVEASSWKLRNGSALEARRDQRAFFYELSRRFAARRQLRVHFLKRDGVVVAGQLGLEYGNRLWELKIAYDESWRHMSPGRILLWEMLHDTFARRLQAYEFLGTGDGQQAAWANGQSALATMVLYPYSASGGLALLRDLTGAVGRRLRRSLAPRRRAQPESRQAPNCRRGST